MKGLIGFLMLSIPVVLTILWLLFDFVKDNGIVPSLILVGIMTYILIAGYCLTDIS